MQAIVPILRYEDARAVAAGAQPAGPPQATDFGAREYHVRDVEGHPWTFGTFRP